MKIIAWFKKNGYKNEFLNVFLVGKHYVQGKPFILDFVPLFIKLRVTMITFILYSKSVVSSTKAEFSSPAPWFVSFLKPKILQDIFVRNKFRESIESSGTNGKQSSG